MPGSKYLGSNKLLTRIIANKTVNFLFYFKEYLSQF